MLERGISAVAPAAGTVTAHRAPGGAFLVVVVLLATLYFAWRRGSLARLWRAVAGARLRAELRGVRVRPIALLPTLALIVALVVLLLLQPGSGARGAARSRRNRSAHPLRAAARSRRSPRR